MERSANWISSFWNTFNYCIIGRPVLGLCFKRRNTWVGVFSCYFWGAWKAPGPFRLLGLELALRDAKGMRMALSARARCCGPKSKTDSHIGYWIIRLTYWLSIWNIVNGRYPLSYIFYHILRSWVLIKHFGGFLCHVWSLWAKYPHEMIVTGPLSVQWCISWRSKRR